MGRVFLGNFFNFSLEGHPRPQGGDGMILPKIAPIVQLKPVKFCLAPAFIATKKPPCGG